MMDDDYSMGREARDTMPPPIDEPLDVIEVSGTYGDVVNKCKELAGKGYKFSRGGYVYHEAGLYSRVMYLWRKI
ncbi:MAG: hypothetical protein GX585_06025 [Clostridiales bacterium]|nr:hypothetical protein [Clostridiales bacterium]